MSFIEPIVIFSHAQASIQAAIPQCNVINADFDGSLNEIKAKNETYTFRKMLKQDEDDSSEFIKIKAMVKEAKDHESHGPLALGSS